MQGAVIRMGGDAEFAGAIAEGMVKAENAALKETIAMLVAENEALRSENGLLKWSREQENGRRLEEARRSAKKATRYPIWSRIALGFMAFMHAVR